MERTLDFEYHSGTLSVINHSTMQPVYFGKLSIGTVCTVDLQRSSKGGAPQAVGQITWSTLSGRFKLTLANGRAVPMERGKNIFSRKTKLKSSQGELTWKGAGALHASLQLLTEDGSSVANLGNLMRFSFKKVGTLELTGLVTQDNELMDEVVLSSAGMLMQQVGVEMMVVIAS